MLTIFDFKAVTKHSYYGQVNRTRDVVRCQETGDSFPSWHAGANDFLARYMDNLDDHRSLIVAHDRGDAYRRAFLPEYKIKPNAKPQNEVEKEQIQKMQLWVKRFLTAIGATQIGVEGVEADDVIAWLCEGQGISAIVHTVDADLLQLVSPSVAVSLKGEFYYDGMDYKELPTTITSVMKSMVGDTSDNYKGIPQFGPAAFLKLHELLGTYGIKNLERIIDTANFEELETVSAAHPDSKQLKMLVEHWGVWLNMWRLAKLHPELCWKPRARKLTKPIVFKKVPNGQMVYDLLKEVGAEDLWKSKYSKMVPGVLAVDKTVWNKQKDQILAEISKSPLLAFDYESSDKNQFERFRKATTVNFVDVLSQEIAGLSVCFGEHLQNVLYFSVDHKDADNLSLDDLRQVMEAIDKSKGTKVAHNAFFEGTLTQKELGIRMDDVRDTRIMQRYFNENEPAGLKAMSAAYLKYEQDSYQKTLDDATQQAFEATVQQLGNVELTEEEEAKLKADSRVTMMCQLTLPQVLKYGADDALVTAHLYDIMELMLRLDQQWDFYQEWAVNPTMTLQSAFLHGVTINWALQKRLQERDTLTIKSEMAKLREILEQNVTGEETEGMRSFIAEESKYMERSLRDKDQDNWFKLFKDWEFKLREACIYIPYQEFEEMPEFAYTPKQLSSAATAVGLPEIEKVTLSYLGQYFADAGLTKADPTEYEGEQAEFLKLLQNAVVQRVDKLRTEETFQRRKAFDDLGTFCQRVSKVQPKIVKIGNELNVGSSAQMRELLYCKIGVPVRLFGTSVGLGRLKLGIKQAGPATDEKAIQTALANDVVKGEWKHEALTSLLKIKSANTRISLFHAKMPMWVHRDGRIHPYITDSGTDTMRPTGSAPNILQIPARGEGAEMRSMYMPPTEDHVCVAIDFSGQELRILACESKDPMMIEAYTPGAEKDIHSMTAVGIAIKQAIKEPNLTPLIDFPEFELARKDDSHNLHALASEIRDKAKACIAKGSLVLTDKGLIEIEKVQLNHKVWDGLNWVTHEGVICKGVQKVITYGTLTATPDHKVFLNDGTSKDFQEIAMEQGQSRIMVGESQGHPIRYAAGSESSTWSKVCHGGNTMLSLPRHQLEGSKQHSEGENKTLQMSADQMENRCTQETLGTVRCSGSAVQQSKVEVLPKLRRKGNSDEVHECGLLCELDTRESTSSNLQRSATGSDRQQRSLRTWEPSFSDTKGEFEQHTQKQEESTVQGFRSNSLASMGLDQDRSSGVSVVKENGNEATVGGENARGDHNSSQENTRWTTVYDIVNAGPLHRFTVSGVVVANCNFGMTYGASAPTVSRNLIVQQSEAEELLDGAFSLYARIKPWQEETARFMDVHGYTLTAFGTKRHATDDIFSSERGLVSRMHRQGVNATIQGTAAESLKQILTRLHTENWLYTLRMEFFAPIYDEIVAWVHKDDVVEYCEVMYTLMSESTPPTHEVPQVPEFSIGADWGRCHELGQRPSSERILEAVQIALAEGEQIWATDMKLSYEDVYGCTPEEFIHR